jgi:hypothetical protein
MMAVTMQDESRLKAKVVENSSHPDVDVYVKISKAPTHELSLWALAAHEVAAGLERARLFVSGKIRRGRYEDAATRCEPMRDEAAITNRTVTDHRVESV